MRANQNTLPTKEKQIKKNETVVQFIVIYKSDKILDTCEIIITWDLGHISLKN